MSKDIRSYFQIKKQKPKVEDDDDIIPESPDVSIKNKKKESRKKRIIQDDSDEETKSKSKKKKPDNLNTSKSKDLKEVKATDMFGGGPLKRSEPIVKKEKKTETGIHFDEDFDKSLLELDALNEIDTVKSETNHGNKTTSDAKKDKNKHKASETTDCKPSTSKDVKISNGRSKIEESKVNNKRKFSEFTEPDSKQDNEDVKNKKIKSETSNNKSIVVNDETDNLMNESHDLSISSKKKKLNSSLNDSALTDEERHERKMYSAALYQKYKNRSGPKNLGAKEMPEGKPNCLKDHTFLLTGVLDSFEREEIVAAITKYGGCIKSSISKKVTHVLAGEEAGPAKMAKAEELGIPILNEDEFLNLLKGSQSKSSKSEEKIDKESAKKDKHSKSKLNRSIEIKKETDKSKQKSDHKKENKDNKKQDLVSPSKEKNSDKKEKIQKDLKRDVKVSELNDKNTSTTSVNSNRSEEKSQDISNTAMWVEKYKPQNVKQIIGQHGDASNVKKLTNWLTKWYSNRKAKLPKPSPWAKNDDGGYYKAALLSGPPGVGKTTSVALVCKELGFDIVEFNASDTRNKTLIKEQIGELLTTTSLSGYAKGDTSKQAVSKKHVLVMDEVDGMAGNEDRGGLQELINLIKLTSVPIICMCNDRNSQKMRSLVNYCYDLRFSRPRVDQIKSAMLSICFKEGIKIPPDVLSQLIVSANQDVRQTLNLLSMWAVDPNLNDKDKLSKDAKIAKKDVKLGPWEAIRKVFSAEDHKTMSIIDKSDLFFYDYSLSPLFVQENYLQVSPHCPKNEILHRFSKAADSISLGDIVEARIRRSQAWGLLPVQAMYSSVIPGNELSGHMTGQIQFPGWLGKNSRANKMKRLCQEIHAHTRLSTSGSKSSIYLDYCTYLRDAIINPLIEERNDGITKSLGILDSYHLLREDLDSLVELSLWPGQRNPTVLIDSKVKAAMTRTYNKTAGALPYAPGSVKRAQTQSDEMDYEDDAGNEVAEDNDDSDPENDGLIKVQKKKSNESQKAGPSKAKPSSSKTKPTKEKSKKK